MDVTGYKIIMSILLAWGWTSIWKARCKATFEGKPQNLSETIECIEQDFDEYDTTQEKN